MPYIRTSPWNSQGVGGTLGQTLLQLAQLPQQEALMRMQMEAHAADQGLKGIQAKLYEAKTASENDALTREQGMDTAALAMGDALAGTIFDPPMTEGPTRRFGMQLRKNDAARKAVKSAAPLFRGNPDKMPGFSKEVMANIAADIVNDPKLSRMIVTGTRLNPVNIGGTAINALGDQLFTDPTQVLGANQVLAQNQPGSMGNILLGQGQSMRTPTGEVVESTWEPRPTGVTPGTVVNPDTALRVQADAEKTDTDLSPLVQQAIANALTNSPAASTARRNPRGMGMTNAPAAVTPDRISVYDANGKEYSIPNTPTQIDLAKKKGYIVR